jgi:DNA-binding transcriptional LysR family regulator
VRRHLSLRQIEAFKAVIEFGTISRAAVVLHVSQPAMSKMIANLELDADLMLFERLKGRLAPTERGMRLYDEIDRIFSGVRQVENAIDAIRRQDQGRIAIGVMPSLSGSFVQRVTTAFLQRHPQVFCVVESRSSQMITERLVTRKLDVGLVSSSVDNPYLLSESLMEYPLVCIMPAGHALVAKSLVRPADLDGLPFVSFDPETSPGHCVAAMVAEHGICPNVVLVANVALMLCEFVAAGHGVSLVHPLLTKGFGQRLVIRPFEPAIPLGFQICRSRDSRNTHLVADFVEVAHETSRCEYAPNQDPAPKQQ